MTEVAEGLAVGNLFLFLMSSLRVHFKAPCSGLMAVTSFVCWHGRQHFSFTLYWWENFPQSFFGKYWKLLCFVSSYVDLSSTDLNRVKKISLNLLVCGTFYMCVLSRFSQVQLFVTLWTTDLQAQNSVQGILQATILCGWTSPLPENLPWREDLFIHLYLNDLETLNKLSFISVSLEGH